MPTVKIVNLQSKSIHCEDKRESLLDILLTATDWMHACGGKGRCTTCKAKIVEGMEHLTPPTRPELQYSKLNKLRDDERLTCQVHLSGDIAVKVPKETQLPHLTYSE
ncbi:MULTISPECIES: 2Fe-2S iron-sulfur cluster-binding protein [unclassified Ekhidna]|jgi:2Fe-2S ferredoxin|uniref:2Fe-2S iron-sulfur cluster-binding protein n=1 Tax=unclassified Ekhidna TaxID=2632188 RepID=UPI0032DE9A4D